MCVRAWCPNCEHFLKERGLNSCALVDFARQPQGGKAYPPVAAWLEAHTDASTRIHPDADGCPGFVAEEL